MKNDSSNYDGFYLLPEINSEGLRMSFFNFNDDFVKGEKIEHTSIGDKYHVIFLVQGEDGTPIIDDHFEAIFADPETYVRGLLGAEVYGCFVRKTENSWKWVEEYLTKTLQRVTLQKLKKYAKSISEN